MQAPESFLPLASLPQECEKELASLCHSLFHQSLIQSWDQGEKEGTLEGALGVTQAPGGPSPSNCTPHPQSSAKPWAPLVIRAAFPHHVIPLNFYNSSSLLSWMLFESPGQGCSSVSLQVRQVAGGGETEQLRISPFSFALF